MNIEDRIRHMAREAKKDSVAAETVMPNRSGYYAQIFWDEYESYVPINDLPKADPVGIWHTNG